MADAAAFSEKMGELQKLRVAVVILLSQENSKLLSRRQRVAGKEIEVLCAERDLARDPAAGGGAEMARDLLHALRGEEAAARQALEECGTEIAKLEALMAKIDADIAGLCQS